MFSLLKKKPSSSLLPRDFDPAFQPIFDQCAPCTMTSPERMYALHKAIAYVVENGIPGDIVECGVWRGGSSMISALSLKALGRIDRNLYLYDTYAGMTEPGPEERPEIHLKWQRAEKDDRNEWCYAALEEVKKNMASTGYPPELIFYVEGKVEKTLPERLPGKIALLRLDTDWFESTKHELTHLYPLLSPGGVLIIDDYGHHPGARKAVDDYFREQKLHPYLIRVDGTGRVSIKQ